MDLKYFFMAEFVCTFYMLGLIWFVQIVHYPLLSKVGKSDFAVYEKAHVDLTAYAVIAVMLIELGCAFLLFWQKPQWLPLWSLWLGCGMLGLIWLSTFFLQVPQHNILLNGYNAQAQKYLTMTNWLRTFGWSVRAAIHCYTISNLIQI
ncbi:hypothetical protein [Candidatus Uabimicrobium sp. HlEnr_7]|uniref:hypothetical protein n=1 Tax=Candidatus Uabimicrobium helgolandensis TaxID=3095367 RepID=UPI0035584568